MSVHTHLDLTTNQQIITIAIERSFDTRDSTSLLSKSLKEAAELLAEEWFAKHRDELFAQVDLDAIRNMFSIQVAKTAAREIATETGTPESSPNNFTKDKK